jgi:biopolymer transport protein ExbB
MITETLHLLPIAAAGVTAAAIVTERTVALVKRYPLANPEAFFEKVGDLVATERLGDAVALCEKHAGKPAAQVARQALVRAHQPEALIENGLEIAVGSAVSEITKRTAFLATIANVATLLGLLGTIVGLIAAFQAVGQADAASKSQLLAQGISTAMNATMLGLAVAIPCMIAYSFLMNRTNRLVAEVDQAASRTLDVIRQRIYRAEGAELEQVTPKKMRTGKAAAAQESKEAL